MDKKNQVIFIIPSQNFQDEEYFETKKIFESKGYVSKCASNFIGESYGKLGGTANVDMLFSEVDAVLYDAIIFIGGQGAITLWDDWRAQGLAKIFLNNNKMVCAIGNSVVILANSGILKEINVAGSSSDEAHIRHGGALYSTESVVVSGNIVTAKGPEASKDFAKVIIDILSK